MDDIEKDILTTLYKKIKNECLRQKRKIFKNSVLVTLIKFTSTNRYRILNEASIPFASISLDSANNMLNKKYIKYMNNGKNLVLTAHGIWAIEKILKENAESDLIDFFEEEDFEKLSPELPLDYREKIILLALIAARAFSLSSSVNLKKTDRINNSWGQIIDAAYNFLHEQKTINKFSKENIYGKTGNEHPVSSLFRHANDLSTKTRVIFNNRSGNQIYFLDLYNESKINISDLIFLFEKIFENKLDCNLMDSVYNFCCTISREKSLYVFDNIKNHIFSTHDYDELIKDSLRKLVLK